MRKVVILTLVLVAVFGCRRKNKGARYANEGPGYEGAPPPAAAAQPSDGNCESACQHYLACKGVNDQATHDSCVTKCAQANYSAQVLSNFVKTDCVSAIYIVEGQGNTNTGGSGGGAPSKDCQGCVWDGSSCIWMSSSNWGSGPYSGAWTACNASCCPGH